MNHLILDTSQKNGVVAFHATGYPIRKIFFNAQDQQRLLMQAITSVTQGVTPDQIAVCIGPGSFTGTRIGVMTARALAYAQGIELRTFHSLLPYHTPGTLTVFNAKHNMCFCFDGEKLGKISFDLLPQDGRQIIRIEEAEYSFEPLLTLTNETTSLIY